MKTACKQIHREMQAIQRGKQAPARAHCLVLDGRVRALRKEIPPETYRREQAPEWERTQAVEARRKLGLSQTEFARLLGINVRTLHNWEQGWAGRPARPACS